MLTEFLGKFFRRSRAVTDPEEAGMNFLVAGLGNIGAEYAGTRHNMGFMVLDAWAQASNTSFHTERYGDIARVSFKGRNFVLLKPSTYMNLSGNAVRYWLAKLGLDVSSLIVVCDDLALPFGTLRMRAGGSDGGHNGLAHIQETLGTKDYLRIRMGIGNDFPAGRQVEYVLGKLEGEQLEAMEELSRKVIEGIKAVATVGPGRAMSDFNRRV